MWANYTQFVCSCTCLLNLFQSVTGQCIVLKEAPLGTVDQALSILSELGPPTNPIWVPLWVFNSPVSRQEAEQKLDALLAGLVETPLIIQTKDMLHFQGYWINRSFRVDKQVARMETMI